MERKVKQTQEDNPQPRPFEIVPGATEIRQKKSFDGQGGASSDCGDKITFYVALSDDDRVEDADCRVTGCANTLLCARVALMLTKGYPVHAALRQTTAENIEATARLPEANRHCAVLAAKAMKEALDAALLTSRHPWRRLYLSH